MFTITSTPVLRSLAANVLTAFSTAETKILRRLRVFSRPAPVRIKVHAPAK